MSGLSSPRPGGKPRVPRWASPVVISGLPFALTWSLLGAAVVLFGFLFVLAAAGALTGGRPAERWSGRIEATVGVISSMRLVEREWWRPRGPRYEIGYEYRPLSGASGAVLHGTERVEARLFSAIRPGDAIEVFYLADKPRESRILLHSGDQREGLAVLFAAFLLVSCYALAANVAANLPRFGRPHGGNHPKGNG